jgi:hypothetical protein
MTLNEALYAAFAGDMNAEPMYEPASFTLQERKTVQHITHIGNAFAFAFAGIVR